MYPRETAEILIFMGYDPASDFIVQSDGSGAVTLTWYSADPQPTDVEVTAQIEPWLRSVATQQAKDALDAATAEQSGNQHEFHRVMMLAVGNNDNAAKTTLKNMGDALATAQAQHDSDIAAFPTMTEAELRAYTGL